MSQSIANVGGSLTGGSTIVLTPSGVSPGKATFVTPDHTRLVTRTVEVTSSQRPPTSTTPGQARAGIKVTFSDVVAEEGCCTPKLGNVVLNFGFSWDLSQPDTNVTGAVDLFVATLQDTDFRNLLLKGIMPQ